MNAKPIPAAMISCLVSLTVRQLLFVVTLPSHTINESPIVAQSIKSWPLISHSPARCRMSKVPTSLPKSGTASCAIENDHVPKTTALITISTKKVKYPRGIKCCDVSLLIKKVFAVSITMTDIILKKKIWNVEISKDGEVFQPCRGCLFARIPCGSK